MSREGVETPPLPPLTANIIVQCLEQDQWLVRIGEGLLDAFLVSRNSGIATAEAHFVR